MLPDLSYASYGQGPNMGPNKLFGQLENDMTLSLTQPVDSSKNYLQTRNYASSTLAVCRCRKQLYQGLELQRNCSSDPI